MKTHTLAKWAIGTVILVAGGLSSAQFAPAPAKVVAEFQGSALSWIHIAEPRFAEETMEVSKYLVTVIDLGDRVSVNLSDYPLGRQKGLPDGKVGFEVVITKIDRKIVSAHYIR